MKMEAATRQREIIEMAVKLTEKPNPTNNEVAGMYDVAAQVVDGIDWALKMVSGEVPRPEKSLREWLEDLQKEIDEGNFDDEAD